MENPSDLISAATETLVKERCELPAFTTLDRMSRRVRALVNGGFFQAIQARLSEAEQHALLALLEPESDASSLTPFNRIKEAPRSATLTHLKEWLSRLTWLESLGQMTCLIEGIPYAKVKHFAEEAHALHATNLKDFSVSKRLALLVCLIYQETVSTR